jgi:hypothetical protein
MLSEQILIPRLPFDLPFGKLRARYARLQKGAACYRGYGRNDWSIEFSDSL